jgi:hypothetical protein
MQIEVAGQFLPIRPSLASAIEGAWACLAGPGTWWSGAERLAVAAEARNAKGCRLCKERKQALSPYAAKGVHDSLGNLSGEAV